MTMDPHLSFGGQCEAAFHFYEQHLGAKILTMLTWGDSPMASQMPADWHGKICHATLTISGRRLMGADVPPGQYHRLAGFHMLLGLDHPAEAERLFQALAENGSVQMPMQETFWALRFGAVTDQFGVSWEINCERPHAPATA